MLGIVGPSSFTELDSAAPLIIANALTSFDSRLLPHLGQAGLLFVAAPLERKLNIFRHLEQANS